MKFELEAVVNETAQNAVDEQTTSKQLVRTAVSLKNQSGTMDLKKGVRATFSSGGTITIDGNGGMNAVHFNEVDSASVAKFENGIVNFQKTQSIKQLQATKSKISAGSSDIQELKLEKSYARLIDCKPMQAEITGGVTESFDGKWQDLTLDGGDFRSTNEEFQQVEISGAVTAVFNKAKFQGDLKVSEGANITFNDCEFQNIDALGHLVFKKGSAQEAGFTGEKTVVVCIDTEFQSIDCQDGKFVLNGVTGKITGKDCEISGKKLKADSIDLDATKAIFYNSDLGSLTAKSSQITIKDCKSDDIDTTDGALKSEKSDGQNLTMQGGTLESINDKFSEVKLDNVLGPNVIRNMEADELVANGDLASKLWLFNTRIQTMETKGFGVLEASACSPDMLKAESISVLMLNDCDVQELNAKKCTQVIAGSSDIQSAMFDTCDFVISNGIQDMIAIDCAMVSDTKSTIQATECTLNIAGSDVMGMNCLVFGQGGTAELTGDSVCLGTGINVTNTGLSVGMGFDPFQSFGSLSYGATGLLLQATVGNLTKLAVEGDVETIATVGNINELAVAGNIDSTATAGNIANTATAGQIANTATAGDIVNTCAGANITEAAAIQLTADTVDVTAGLVNLP